MIEENEQITQCEDCGDELSPEELANGEETCYPCQKGNTN